MSTHRPEAYLKGLVEELRKLTRETEWVEFKHNNDNPQEIGEYISALANAAALHGKASAYLIWGVDDDAHDVIGTTFSPSTHKVGNEELENWLLHSLEPKLDFSFFEVTYDGSRVIVLEIDPAFRQPARFKGQEWIRVGSYKKRLKDHPEKERELWRVFERSSFEEGIALERSESDRVLELLDYPAYFSLLELPLPAGREGILEALEQDKMIVPCEAGGWNITNLGAILFARRLDDFASSLSRKAVRVVQYKEKDRIETRREQVGLKGYANGFGGLLTFIDGLLPANEVIEKGLRKSIPMVPQIAVREVVANAFIHQDFFVTGAGPIVEIFSDRVEVTNPGEPLVAANRFLDSPPRSRNERLASLLRRMGICEDRGSGIDKVVSAIEDLQLPAPLFEVAGDSFTRVVLFGHKALSQMEKEERVRACYLHACLKYVSRDFLTNTSLRERFGVDQKNKASVSRYIKEAVQAGAIAPYDPDAAPKMMKYIPFWAVPQKPPEAEPGS